MLMKIALISLSNKSDWVSCISIHDNILATYRSCNIKMLEYVLDQYQEEALAQKIVDEEITHLIFTDHRILPGNILFHLVQLSKKKLPEIIFHVYGDFVVNTKYWKAIEESLINFTVKFICASKAQAEVVEKLLQQKNKIVSTIPFPVGEFFKHDPKRRSEARETYKLFPEHFVLCYSGRISLQKNVLHIIKAFNTINQIYPDTRLFIAGPFDKIGLPYLGLARLPLAMETEFYSLIDSLPQHVRKNVTYLGNMGPEKLLDLYHASDMYLSLSAHNDEDFGMAPAEALCCGLPLFISDWGGFKDFKKNLDQQVTLFPLSLEELGYRPGPTLAKSIIKSIQLQQNSDLTKNAEEAQKIYHCSSLKNSYLDHLNKRVDKFAGFSELFEQVVTRIVKLSPFLDEFKGYDDVYFELYQSYQ